MNDGQKTGGKPSGAGKSWLDKVLESMDVAGDALADFAKYVMNYSAKTSTTEAPKEAIQEVSRPIAEPKPLPKKQPEQAPRTEPKAEVSNTPQSTGRTNNKPLIVVGLLALLCVAIIGGTVIIKLPRQSEFPTLAPPRQTLRAMAGPVWTMTPKAMPARTNTPVPTTTSISNLYNGNASDYIPLQSELPSGFEVEPSISGNNPSLFKPHSEAGLLSNYGKFYHDLDRRLNPTTAWGVYFSVKVYDSALHAQPEFDYWANETWQAEGGRRDKIKELQISGVDENMWQFGITKGEFSIVTESRIIFRKVNVMAIVDVYSDIQSAAEMEESAKQLMQDALYYVGLVEEQIK
jgi:hypothetical protein